MGSGAREAEGIRGEIVEAKERSEATRRLESCYFDDPGNSCEESAIEASSRLRPACRIDGGSVGLRRIGRKSDVEVEVPLAGRVKGHIAVAVGGVAGASAGGIVITGRADELPDRSVRDAAGGGRRRVLRDNAAGRGGTGIVVDPIAHFARADMIANVVGGDDGVAISFIDDHPGTVDASAEAETREFV